MPASVSVDEYLRHRDTTPMVDVRSPGEFARGHIPGAINLPLFDDQQRAEIGTLYKQAGRQAALLRGLEIAGSRIEWLAETATGIASQSTRASSGKVAPRLLVHCWRGGMRSRSVGWLIEQMDVSVKLLRGGYQAWRRAGHVLFAQPWRLVVLGGLTGSGKTRQLALLAQSGEQVVDLEGLANHRGSAFGAVGLGPQPSVEQFENRLHEQLRRLDATRRVWIEAESQLIGRVFIPRPFFCQAVAAPMIEIEAPLDRRVELLTTEYSGNSPDELIAAVEKIRKRLGGQNVQEAVAAIQTGDFSRCVRICLKYYDKSYGNSRYLGGRPVVESLQVNEPHSRHVAARLIRIADELPGTASVVERGKRTLSA